MRYYRVFMYIFILILMAAQAYAQDDYLNPSDSGANSAASQDIKHTMGDENIFNVSPQAGATIPAKGAVMISAKNTKFPQSASSASSIASSIAGSISLVLTDSTIRSITIVLTQSGDIVFGKGSMISGGVTQDIAATGSVSGNNLNMDLLSMKDTNLYKLSIDISGRSLSGSYSAFGSSPTPWTGTITGTLA